MAGLEQSPANSSILYAARYGNKLFRSDNCMAVTPIWTDLTTSLPGTGTPSDLEAHPTDPNTVYMAFGTGVFKSMNKGQSWSNITGNLPSIHMNSLVFDTNSLEALYVGTDAGVYYQDPTTSGWVAFNTGLPVSVEVTELEIYYDNDTASFNAIRASTYGRGLWGSALYNVDSVDFVADSTSICEGLSVDYTDMSTGSPSSWSWSFPGGTPSISSLQNPQNIEYSTPGSYDVTLTTDWNTYYITNTKTNYITVDPLPGNPETPQGDTALCMNNVNTTYTTFSVVNATGYTWTLDPSTVGVLVPSDTSVVIDWDDTWTGLANLTAQATNDCGTGASSPPLQINLQPLPGQPNQPTGLTPLCQGAGNTAYTTGITPYAISYMWDLSPVGAGTISGTDTIGTVTWGTTFTGLAAIKVKSVNECGESSWSESWDVTVNSYPIVNLGDDTTITYLDTLLLDAGNPGSTYLWSTGASTQTIKAYYEGSPTTNYWVDVTTTNCTGNDEILVTFTDPVSISERDEHMVVRIFPNPNNGQFTLELTAEKPGEASFQIFDLAGRMITEQENLYINGKKTTKISLPNLPVGMFYMKLRKEGFLFVEKFLVIN